MAGRRSSRSPPSGSSHTGSRCLSSPRTGGGASAESVSPARARRSTLPRGGGPRRLSGKVSRAEVALSECRFFHVDAGTGLQRLAGPDEALRARQRSGYVWMDLRDPTRQELDAVAGPLGIHPLAVEDCLDQEQIPKIEDYPGHSFILFNRFTYRDKELIVEEVDFLLGKNFLVTVAGHGGSDGGAFEKVEALAGVESAAVEKGPDFLLHVLLDHTVDSKVAAIEALEDLSL